MNLRWLWFDYVDPQLNLTREQRRSVRRMAQQYIHNKRTRLFRPWLFTVACIGMMSALGVVSLSGILGALALRSFGLFLAVYLALYVIAWIPIAWVGGVVWKPAFNAALRKHGYDVCIKCGYLLHGLPLTVTHCPECGTKRDNPLIE